VQRPKAPSSKAPPFSLEVSYSLFRGARRRAPSALRLLRNPKKSNT
jgi:hypothetical protein